MEIINKILRISVYIMLSILLTVDAIYLSLCYSIGGFTSSNRPLDTLFISFSLILYIFAKNKESKNCYNILLLIVGIFIIRERYLFYPTNRNNETFMQDIFSISSIFDIGPLCLIYLSTICTYFVSKK